MKKNSKILLLILFLVTLWLPKNIYAAEKTLSEVEVTFTSTVFPVHNNKFTIKNLQNAYNKIKEGKITSDDIHSAAWQSTEQQKGVTVGDTFGINPGVRHTPEETESILRNMCNSGAISLVNELNNNPSSTANFHYPGNIARRYTNNEGRAVATTEIGINGIFNNDGNLVQLIHVKAGKTTKLSIDINSTTNLFKGKIANLSNKMKANDNSYTVEFGQELTYQLTIDKSLLSQDLPLTINPQTNLVIDDISVPFSKIPVYGDVISLQSLGITADSSISSKASLSVLKSQIQTKFYQNMLWGYAVNIPQTDTDVTITIKAHLAPEVALNSELQGVEPDGSLTPMEFVVGNINLTPKTNFFMTIVATTATGSLSYNMPTVRTSGINFASVDSSGTKLGGKESYLLGYEENNQKYVYGNNQWNSVGSLEAIDLNTVQIFSGGNRYYLGGAATAIPINTELFSFNLVKNRRANDSLIKFIGLGQGRKYFLYPIDSKHPEKKELPFTVYNKDSLQSNGQEITQTSIGSAQYEDSSINSLIPDYKAGSVEYNVTISNQNSIATSFGIVIKIVGMCLLIIAILIAICWKG